MLTSTRMVLSERLVCLAADGSVVVIAVPAAGRASSGTVATLTICTTELSGKAAGARRLPAGLLLFAGLRSEVMREFVCSALLSGLDSAEGSSWEAGAASAAFSEGLGGASGSVRRMSFWI